MNEMTLVTITLALFLIMDPIGNISAFLTTLKGINPTRQKYIILREMFIALFFMLLFNYLGETLLNYLQLSSISLHLTSGLILFFAAIKILFPAKDSLRANLPEGEPFIVPLAIPLIAGPSLLATIMLFANLEVCKKLMLVAIFFSWMAAVVVLLLAPYLNRWLGKNGLMACERLMAMVLVMLAIQRFMEGLTLFFHSK